MKISRLDDELMFLWCFSDESSDLPCLSKLTLPTTPAPTDGSQCSSSCSTVVVTGYSHEKAKTQVILIFCNLLFNRVAKCDLDLKKKW